MNKLTPEQRKMLEQSTRLATQQRIMNEAARAGGIEIKPKPTEQQFSYQIVIGTPEGVEQPRVIVDFSRTIKWFSLSPGQARDMARNLVKVARALEKIERSNKESK